MTPNVELGISQNIQVRGVLLSKHLGISTLATFFSSITATTLQFSYTQNTTLASKAVNGFWFMSLVFSIAAAGSGVLSTKWLQSSEYGYLLFCGNCGLTRDIFFSALGMPNQTRWNGLTLVIYLSEGSYTFFINGHGRNGSTCVPLSF